MAIKDWKQRDKDYWGNEKTQEVIWIKSFMEHRKSKGKGKKYSVFVNPGILKGTFKTKTQALRYAKAYMRKH